MKATADERFRGFWVITIAWCMQWVGAVNSKGYGVFGFGGKGKSVLAHRWAYERHRGPIPPGMTIDHLCRNQRCVRSDHLEVVTRAENVRRGGNAAKTSCKWGHPLSGANLYVRPGDGKRQCITCRDEHRHRPENLFSSRE